MKGSRSLNKKELLPIAWHPNRYWGCCMSEDEKKETEKLWEKTWTFLYWMTGYKKFFDLKRIINKDVFFAECF